MATASGMGVILESKLTTQDRKQAQTPIDTIRACLQIYPI